MRKLISLCLVLVIAVGLLTGCGKAQEEVTIPTVTVSETEIPATEVVTEPTEPKTLFEQEGYVLWDGWLHGTQERSIAGLPVKVTSSNRNTVQTSMIVWHDKNKNEQWDLGEEYKTGLVDSQAIINITEYSSDCFSYTPAMEIADRFYEAYNADAQTKISREEWLELHSDYVIKEVFIDFDVECTSFVRESSKSWGRWA